MNLEPRLQRLQARPRFGDGPGLHRMAALANALPDDAHGPLPPSIRITGTNGKGSTAAMVAAILLDLGFETGLYTSPHFLRWNERIALDGCPVADDELVRALDWFFEVSDAYESRHPGDGISAFEAATAVALHVYGRRRPDALVVEAGMGGRLDPTRMFPGELVGLTSLDLEHTEVLGETLLEIALDKADLCPDGGVLVVGKIEPETLRRLDAAVALRGVETLSLPRHAEVRVHGVDASGTRFGVTIPPRAWLPELRWSDLHLGLPGAHQAGNAAVAILLVREWLAAHGPEVAADSLEASVRRALSGLQVPGRLHRVRQEDPPVYVDVAHTPNAIQTLASTVHELFPSAPPVLLLGASEGRDAAALLAPLLNHAEGAVVTRAPQRGAPTAEVAAAIQRTAPDLRMKIIDDPETAHAAALEWARSAHRAVLVAGSLFLASAAVGWASAHPSVTPSGDSG